MSPLATVSPCAVALEKLRTAFGLTEVVCRSTGRRAQWVGGGTKDGAQGGIAGRNGLGPIWDTTIDPLECLTVHGGLRGATEFLEFLLETINLLTIS